MSWLTLLIILLVILVIWWALLRNTGNSQEDYPVHHDGDHEIAHPHEHPEGHSAESAARQVHPGAPHVASELSVEERARIAAQQAMHRADHFVEKEQAAVHSAETAIAQDIHTVQRAGEQAVADATTTAARDVRAMREAGEQAVDTSLSVEERARLAAQKAMHRADHFVEKEQAAAKAAVDDVAQEATFRSNQFVENQVDPAIRGINPAVYTTDVFDAPAFPPAPSLNVDAASAQAGKPVDSSQPENNQAVQQGVLPYEAPLRAAASALVEDLIIIEGIGPRVKQILEAAGITTFAQLAALTPDYIRELLVQAGINHMDPTTWPKQALLAAEGKHEELKVYQDHLKGGRE